MKRTRRFIEIFYLKGFLIQNIFRSKLPITMFSDLMTGSTNIRMAMEIDYKCLGIVFLHEESYLERNPSDKIF